MSPAIAGRSGHSPTAAQEVAQPGEIEKRENIANRPTTIDGLKKAKLLVVDREEEDRRRVSAIENRRGTRWQAFGHSDRSRRLHYH